MILDIISNRQFVVKNTYYDNKKFTILVGHENSTDELFFVHIKLTDEKVAKAHDDEPLINAEFKEIEIKTKFNEKIWTTLFGNLFVFHSSLFLLTSTLK